VASGENYLSRFFTKFIEISAAGVATAVSGYVVAHLAGYMNGQPAAALPSPAALQVPATSPLPSAAPITVPAAPVAVPAASSAAVTSPAVTSSPVAPAPVASAPAAPTPAASARATATATPQPQDAKSAPLRKSLPADRPADTANAADSQPRSADSIAAEVRAALAKADAAHPAKTETKPDSTPARRAERPAEVATRTPAAEKPRPAETPTGTLANVQRNDTPHTDAPPRAAAITPPAAQPQIAPQSQPSPQPLPQPVAQPGAQAPMQIAPPTTVEIKSMPVAGVDAAQAASPTDTQDAQTQPNDGGIFSVFKRLPEKLRDDKPLPPDQAPRPPADVGQ
jgi:hypothetical protein